MCSQGMKVLDQVALGYFRKLQEWEAILWKQKHEHKKIKNKADYIDGNKLKLLTKAIEQVLLNKESEGLRT